MVLVRQGFLLDVGRGLSQLAGVGGALHFHGQGKQGVCGPIRGGGSLAAADTVASRVTRAVGFVGGQ